MSLNSTIFHPIFYNSQDKVRFVHVVKKLINLGLDIFRELLQLEHNPGYNKIGGKEFHNKVFFMTYICFMLVLLITNVEMGY